MAAVFEARRRGGCAACPDGIEVGDQVTWSEDDEVVHVHCLLEQRPPKPAENEVCGRCFTEKSTTGACLCDDD